MRRLISASLVGLMLVASPVFAQGDSGGAGAAGTTSSGGATPGGTQNGIQNGTRPGTTPGVTGSESDGDKAPVALLILGSFAGAGLLTWAVSTSGSHGTPASP